MTREEAIKHIKAMCQMLFGADNKPISDTYYALEMAISALSAEPCEDAISRQAAIYELKKYFLDDGMKDTEYGAYWHHVHVIEVLKSMPSVTPKQRTGHWIEEDGYDGDTYYDCSVCGESWTTIEGTPWDNGMKYCPNCGADMREDLHDES